MVGEVLEGQDRQQWSGHWENMERKAEPRQGQGMNIYRQNKR